MPSCGLLDVGCVARGVARTGFEQIALLAGEASGKMLGAAMTWWINTDSVNPDSAAVLDLQKFTVPIALAMLVGSVLNQSIRMTITRKKDPAINVGLGLIRYAIVTTIGLGLLAGSLKAGDDFASWLSDKAIGDFSTRMSGLLGPTVLTNPFLLIFLGTIALLLAGIQWVLGWFRQGGILVLAALLPLAASGSINDSTKMWLNRLMPWLLALVLYKPIAAMIYTIGFGLMGTGRDVSTVMTGLVVLVLATVAMPAMMRFFSWSQATVTSGGGAGGVLAAGATGAASIAALQGSRSMTNSGPGTGPTGANPQSTPSNPAPPVPPSTNPSPSGPSPFGGMAGQPGAPGAGGPVPTGAASGSAAGGAGGTAAGGGAAAGGAAAAAGPVGVGVAAAAAAAQVAKGASDTATDQFTGGEKNS